MKEAEQKALLEQAREAESAILEAE